MPVLAARRAPLEDLRRVLPDLPEGLQAVGRYITEHEFDATTRSMRELASTAKLQPAAFTRLAQAIGRSGWDEFRNELIEAHRPRNPGPYTARVGRNRGSDDPNDPIPLLEAIQGADVGAVGRVDVSSIARAIPAIKSAPRVWVAGYRSCRVVAELVQYQLRLFRDDVKLVGAPGSEDLDFGEFRKGDAVITISFAPYTRLGLATVRAARRAGCILISITDSPISPYAEGANYSIVYDASSTPAFFPSLTGAVHAAQALVAGVFKLGGDQSASKLRKTEARLAALHQYISEDPKR
jgi:DNA-binding MurR/RpiR family transcriptional regulator